MPVEETSPNAKGVYEKVLALLLTSLTGGTRFSHVTWWSHGIEGLKACFAVVWLPQATSVLTRFFGKFRQRHNEQLRTAAVGLAGRLIEEETITEDTLILDSTVCQRYGAQEGARRGDNGHGGDDLRGNADFLADMVRDDVVCDESEGRG
jgi:hypothetical protein